MPFDQPVIFLRDGDVVEIAGQVPIGRLLADSPLSAMASVLPERWSARPVWLHVQARVSLEVEAARGHRRYLRLDVERFSLGRQWLPGVVVRPLLSRGVHDLFRWPLPAAVEAITIDSEKVVVRTAS